MATPPNQMGLTGPVQANDIVMRASEIGTTIPGIASLAMKSARKGAQRGVQGIYQLPSGNEPTPEFMNVSQQNLNNQTRQMTNMLNMMAPEDEQLAYINEQEAGILKLLGGSGEMTPQGIPTYRGIGGYGGGDEGPGSGSSGSSNGSNGSNGSGGGGGGGGSQTDTDTDTGRPDMGDITGGYNTPSGEKPSPGNLDRDTGADNVEDAQEKAKNLTEKQKEINRDIVDAGATVTGAGTAMVDSEGGLIAAGKALSDFRQDREDRQIREAYARNLVDAMSVNPMAREMRSMDPDYGYVDAGDVSSETLGSMSAQGTLDNMGDRLGELTAKAKANTISNTELNELAQLNEFYGKNPTTGMGIVESLEYQFTNPEFKEDLAKAAPVLGAAALVGFAPGIVKTIMGINNLMKTFNVKPSTSLRTTIENQLKKLTGKERKALASTLPSTYKGFGIQGEDRGQGGDRRAEEEARRRREAEANKGTGEEEDTRERDRFERAFANRYFVGPASLDEVRKYAITGGGYNQLTPFYGREKETV